MHHVGGEDVALGQSGAFKGEIEESTSAAGERDLRPHARFAAQALPDNNDWRLGP